MENYLFNALLDYYQINESEYKKLTRPLSINSFLNENNFDRIEETVNALKKIIKEKKKILIYGDYDADGMMATSILVKMFSYLHYPVSYYIPNRYQDGYAINMDKAKLAVEKGIEAVITVDNGINAIEPIKFLKDNGVLTFILDHHEISDEMANGDYILHPIYSHFGNTPTSAGFVAFVFAWKVLGYFDKYLAYLASISVVSDLMPLKDYNRDLLRLSFSLYHDGDSYVIDTLKESSEPFSANSIGMKIGPKINAIGRIVDNISINNVVKCFTEDNHEKQINYINWILDIYKERRNITDNSEITEAFVPNESNVIFGITKEKEGICGLIASRLLSKYKCPVIILAEREDGLTYRGSCRVPNGYDLINIFDKCGSLISGGGGHSLAAGCTVKKEDYEAFKEKVSEIIASYNIKKEEKEPITLSLTDLNKENCELIASFGPFGMGWEAPKFRINKILSSSLKFSRDGKHIHHQIGYDAKIVGFNFPREKVLEHKFIDAVGTIAFDYFRYSPMCAFSIIDLFESK